MRVTTPESVLAATAPTMSPPADAAADARPASASTDFLQVESIVLNLDASLRVHARAHFFSWTQGLLQSLIRHELLVCVLCHGKPPVFRADGFSMTTPEPSLPPMWKPVSSPICAWTLMTSMGMPCAAQTLL